MTTDRINTTHRFRRITIASLLPLLILLAACDSVDSNAVDAGCSLTDAAAKAGCGLPPSDEVFAIVFTAAPSTAGLQFRTLGAIRDAGRVDGDQLWVGLAGPYPGVWSGTRRLQGVKGVLALSFEGFRTEDAHPRWTGRFTMQSGSTGAYAGLRGEGIFEVTLNKNGRPVETFVGTLSR